MEGTLYLDGMWHYTQGSGQVGRGELEAAERSLGRLRTVAEDPVSRTLQRASNSVAVLMELAAFGLEGEIKEAQGNLDGAIAAFESAVAIEDTLAYTEPPDWAQPMRHYLGAALLEAGNAVEAERVYRRDMSWNRNDGWALFGLWQSLEAQGKTDEAEAVYADFQDLWKEADAQLSRSRF